MKEESNTSLWAKLFGRNDYGGEYYEDYRDDDDEENYEDEKAEYDDEYEEDHGGGGLQEDDRATMQKQETTRELDINLVDRGNEFVAQAVIAGIEEEDVDVVISREMLEVKTSSNTHNIENDGEFLYEELMSGRFSRALLLPAEVDVDQSKAKIKNGILTVTMPKIDKTTKKKLSVKGK